jgi:uncharacterized protein YegJ (DUF2314 family)
MHRLTCLLIFVFVLPASGCRRQRGPKEGELVQRPQNPPVAYVADNDGRLREASRRAQQSLQSFVDALERPQATQLNHAVKATFQDGKDSEAIWLTALRFDGKEFHGTVSNEPVHLKNVHLGSKVSIEAAKVNDWMMVDNGRLVGGYTIRVVRENLPPDDRKRFEQTVPFMFD